MFSAVSAVSDVVVAVVGLEAGVAFDCLVLGVISSVTIGSVVVSVGESISP